MPLKKHVGEASRHSAVLPRGLFPTFRDWLVWNGWRIEQNLVISEILRATRQVTKDSKSRLTIFGYNSRDEASLIFFDEAARQVNLFKADTGKPTPVSPEPAPEALK